MTHTYRARRLLTAAPILALVATAAAEARGMAGGPEFEAGFTRETSDWRLGDGGRVQSRINRLGIDVRDRVSDSVRIGLHGGYLGMTQSGDTITPGADLEGWYLGTSAHWRMIRTDAFSLSLNGRFTYNEADDRQGVAVVRYTWHEIGAGLESAYRIDHAQLRLGVDAAVLDGDERHRGTQQQTRSLSEDRLLTARAALDLLVDPTGRISFQVETGARRGAGIWFARQF